MLREYLNVFLLWLSPTVGASQNLYLGIIVQQTNLKKNQK